MARSEDTALEQADQLDVASIETTDSAGVVVKPINLDESIKLQENGHNECEIESSAPVVEEIKQNGVESNSLSSQQQQQRESLTDIEIGPLNEIEKSDAIDLDKRIEETTKLENIAEPSVVQQEAGSTDGKQLTQQQPKKLPVDPFYLTQDRQRITSKPGMLRHIVAVLALSSIVLANMNRQVFNQALVSMTKMKIPTNVITEPTIFTTTTFALDNEGTTTVYYESTPSPSDDVPPSEDVELAKGVQEHELLVDIIDEVQEIDVDDRYDWDGGQISTLQAAFSYGYMPFMILGGRLSEMYGAKWVVFVSGFGSAICCVFLPFFADSSFELLVASRVLMGLCQTGVSPALYALLTRWLPQDESSVYLPMIKVGVMVGYMCGSLVVGFFPWRLTFYMTGLIGLLWCALWVIMVTSDPSDHKMISKKELSYIQWELNRLNKDRPKSIGDARKKAAPWKNILTNPVVVAFMFSKFTVKLSTDAQSMQIPMYLKNVFHVSKELNGILSATNFALQGIFTGLVAWTAKEFAVRKVLGLDKTGVRRLFQGVNSFGMAAAFMLMTFNMSSLSFVSFTVIMVSVSSMFGAGGEAVTPVDLSTEYAASIMAIANSLANTSGIVLPPLITFILDNELDSADNWNLAWRILATIVLSGGVVYTCFVTADLQDFTKGSFDKKTKTADKSDVGVVIEMKTRVDEDTEHHDEQANNK